jgi:hypothetical protein
MTALLRVIAGGATETEREWAMGCVATFMHANGVLPLERCLRLPTTSTAWARSQRDYWLRRAAAHLVDERNPTDRAKRLSRELARFLRCRWPSWALLRQPPENATDLDVLLFYVRRASGDLVRFDLGWRRLVDVLEG